MAAHKTLSWSIDEVEMYQEHHQYLLFRRVVHSSSCVCVSLWLSKREWQRVTVNVS